MAWCRQATSHYLSQRWPRSMSPYGVIRPQWVKGSLFHNSKIWISRDPMDFSGYHRQITTLFKIMSSEMKFGENLFKFLDRNIYIYIYIYIYTTDGQTLATLCEQHLGTVIPMPMVTVLALCEGNPPVTIIYSLGMRFDPHNTCLDATTHPCSNLNGRSLKKLEQGWVITSQLKR